MSVSEGRLSGCRCSLSGRSVPSRFTMQMGTRPWLRTNALQLNRHMRQVCARNAEERPAPASCTPKRSREANRFAIGSLPERRSSDRVRRAYPEPVSGPSRGFREVVWEARGNRSMHKDLCTGPEGRPRRPVERPGIGQQARGVPFEDRRGRGRGPNRPSLTDWER